jgi:hypothetical protein
MMTGDSMKNQVLRHHTLLAALLTLGSIARAEDDMPPPPVEPEYSGDMAPEAPVSSSGNATPGKPGEDDENIIRKPKEAAPPPPKEFSKAEAQKACAKYQGKLLSVYGEIYKIQNCVRHRINEQEDIFKFSRQGVPVVEVNSTDVAAIPVGDSWENTNSKDRPCATFNKKYITYSYTDIYYVENCVRKLIPDYETLLAHRKERGQQNGEVLALSAKEFWSMKQGRDITSIIDKEFHKLLEGSAGVDIIPIDEACKGVEGKIVTFYSRMYKIEKCRKREIDAESFTMHSKAGNSKLTELRPEQWISMPDGKPYTEKK